ncbi:MULTISPECIES: hypothetical protein [Bartonella]|uniref:hypothetical protein n=1 Tax=Bartonella TaxID=773 RepID=UPI00235FE035|nr:MULTISPECIES: hypothetical protein [Bartonella]
MCRGVMMVVLGCFKRKDVGAQWILQYIIYGHCREMGVASVERCLFQTSAWRCNTKAFCFLM